MFEAAIKHTEERTLPRKPKVNKRSVNLNGGKEITPNEGPHNPPAGSILVTGFERSIEEYSEIGASFIKEE